MTTIETLRNLALSFPETSEEPHFEKTSFRVQSKIFATYNEKEKWATLKFKADEQSMFCKIDAENIFPVPNAWGRSGWTHIRINNLSKEIMEDLLMAAYISVANKKLTDKLLNNNTNN